MKKELANYLYIYIYITKAFEAPTIFHISIIFKKLKLKLKAIFTQKKKPSLTRLLSFKPYAFKFQMLSLPFLFYFSFSFNEFNHSLFIILILIPCRPYLIWFILLTIPQLGKKKRRARERESEREREKMTNTSMASLKSFSARFVVAPLRYVTIFAVFSVNLSL